MALRKWCCKCCSLQIIWWINKEISLCIMQQSVLLLIKPFLRNWNFKLNLKGLGYEPRRCWYHSSDRKLYPGIKQVTHLSWQHRWHWQSSHTTLCVWKTRESHRITFLFWLTSLTCRFSMFSKSGGIILIVHCTSLYYFNSFENKTLICLLIASLFCFQADHFQRIIWA